MRPKLPLTTPYKLSAIIDRAVYQKVQHLAVDRGQTVGEVVRVALAALVDSSTAPHGKGSRATKP